MLKDIGQALKARLNTFNRVFAPDEIPDLIGDDPPICIILPGRVTYNVTLDGEYWDVVTLNNCSSDKSNHIVIVITGINEPQSGTISVYPNPGDGQFTIRISSLKQESFNISVVNNIGLKIMEIKDLVVNGNIEKYIDLRPIPSGIYSLVIQNSETKFVKKLLVNK